MPTRLLTFVLFSVAASLAACRGAPSKDDALHALRAAEPAVETTTVIARVWTDGPPWFSCAEVIAKSRSAADSQVVRDQVGNWRSLVLADWVALRDTGAREVVDPGWCVANVRDEAARRAGGWRAVTGDTIPSGGRRRGWEMAAGRRQFVVNAAPRGLGGDSAAADYIIALAPNANGTALGADKDSTRFTALLRRDGRSWTVANPRWASPAR